MRIDVIFDIEVCYRSEFIKEGTGTKRKKGHQPVRRQIDNELVPFRLIVLISCHLKTIRKT